MIRIDTMTFNLFQVNTYFLSDETGECIIIDAACYDAEEKGIVRKYLSDNKLRLVRNLNTHCHVDHVLGNEFIADTYHVNPEYHPGAAPFLLTIKEMGLSFGFHIGTIPAPARNLVDNEIIRWGHSSLRVLYAPGHAEGSVCFYSEAEKFVITGDVLFKDTIGRTDLPTGNLNILLKSIQDRLFTLPPDTVVYPGHGPETTIGYEINNNPFIR